MSARRRIVAAGVAGLVLLLQVSLVVAPAISGADFDRRAAELTQTSRWRYGYVLQRHGAVLVKARPTDATGLSTPRAQLDHVSIIMARELRLRPWKAASELAFYTSLFGLFCSRTALLRRARLTRLVGLRRTAVTALLATLFLTAFMSPYLVAGYGEPLFSTRQGPGAVSYSGLVPATGSLNTPAVSYGMALQAVLIGPLVCAQWAAEPLTAWFGIRGSLWLVAVVVWSLVAAGAASRYARPRTRDVDAPLNLPR